MFVNNYPEVTSSYFWSSWVRVCQWRSHRISKDSAFGTGDSLSNLAIHFDIFDGNTASTFWKDGQTKDWHGNWDLLVAWERSAHHHIHALELRVEDGATVALTRWTTAAKRQAGGSSLAAKSQIEAAESSLSRATNAVSVVVNTAVYAAHSATKCNIFLIDSVTSRTHDWLNWIAMGSPLILCTGVNCNNSCFVNVVLRCERCRNYGKPCVLDKINITAGRHQY